MVRVIRNVEQTLLRGPHSSLEVTEVDAYDLVNTSFLQTLDIYNDDVGVACSQNSKGVITHLAFATSSQNVLCVCLTDSGPKKNPGTQANVESKQRGNRNLQRIFLHNEQKKLAFDMHKLALALFFDYGLTVTQAVDLQSSRPDNRRSVSTLFALLGDEAKVNKGAIIDAFRGETFVAGGVENLAVRAWAVRQAALRLSSTEIHSIPLIDTSDIPSEHVTWLANFARISWRLHEMKPTWTKHDVATRFKCENGNATLQVQQTRFKTRLRASQNQTLEVHYGAKNGPTKIAHGRTTEVKGRSAHISINKAIDQTAKLLSVVTIGKDDPTAAEKERDSIVLAVLQRKTSFFDQPIVQRIFSSSLPAHSYATSSSDEAVYLSGRRLNSSQARAVHRIVSERQRDQVFLVQGPPGTGKTTVIAAAVVRLMAKAREDEPGIWLISQSNVAVKHIAEKLADVGFLDFKILVSEDFLFEWHEHLYKRIKENVIPSDEFADNPVGNARLLLGSRVILCTLSMLATHRLMSAGFTRLVPVEMVIVDEASQIELGDYLPLLSRFGRDIKKLVFVGDDKQLAPYGQDDIGELPSIFERPHLRDDAVFLDTQYRMPVPIGAFISKHVYSGRLKTRHAQSSRRTCALVDISHGQEAKSGNSWTNDREVDAVVVVARKFHSEGKRYKVITPYDAQRTLLERRLEDAMLPWQDKCFNVDSFQGNEEDYIIVSVVRSDKPGFLTNSRRTNVMLSRCKRGMVVCASREFLDGKAKATLMGRLSSEWADGWVSWRDALQGKFLNVKGC